MQDSQDLTHRDSKQQEGSGANRTRGPCTGQGGPDWKRVERAIPRAVLAMRWDGIGLVLAINHRCVRDSRSVVVHGRALAAISADLAEGDFS